MLSDGSTRRLGNLSQPDEHLSLMGSFPVYGDDTTITPMFREEDWPKYCRPAFEENLFLPPIADQDGIGMCNASATASLFEYTRAKQGLEYVELSAGDLYRRICGGSDNGSTLQDGMRESKNGIAPTSLVPYLDWRRSHVEAPEARKKFAWLEIFIAPTLKEFMSGIIAGFGGVTGMPWYDSYSRLDGDGFLPAPGGRYGGHAIFAHTPVITPSGRIGIEHNNSWTIRHGNRGRFVAPLSVYRNSGSFISGLWLVRSVVDEGGRIPGP